MGDCLMFGGTHSLSMQSKQTRTDLHRWACASIALQKRTDRRLTTRHKISQGLLGQPSRNQFGGNFLKVHTSIITFVFMHVNTIVFRKYITFVI
jgi:hypothetical protein